MPEWPDLHVVRGRLERALVGRRITRVETGDPVVVRALRPIDELLVGRTFRVVRHRGKITELELDGVRIVVLPMLSGLFELGAVGSKRGRDTRVALALDDGTELRYRDDTRMGKVYVIGEGSRIEVPGMAELGPEAGTLDWSAAELGARLRGRRNRLRNLLMDQSFVAGIGNAYADELLWAARLHPRRTAASLTPEEVARLRDALRDVIAAGVAAVEAGLPPQLGVKVRDHLKVRGRAGEPCPRCGKAITRTREGDGETYLCTACQPPPKGALR